MQTVFIVEVESGSSEHGSAMQFDSVWDDLALAEEYCKRFKTMGGFGQPWPYEITEKQLNKGS